MALYPKLKKKLGLIGAICLITWGLFILGMQLYVFNFYSQVYGEGTAGPSWSNAYTGMALANSAACLFFGLFYIIAFSGETTFKALLWGIILAVVGAGAAAASTVLTALEADWLNTAVNTESDHPCKAPALPGVNTENIPTPLICTNWLALEVTVSVLSGLAFSEYIFIGCVIFMGLSGGKHSDNDHPGPYHHNSSANKVEPQQPLMRVNNNPQMKGIDGPYNAYNQSSPSKPKSPGPAVSQTSYDDFNPQYSYHLQQLSLQQMAQQSAKPPQKNSPALHSSHGPAQPHREAPAVPLDSQINRGRLQVLHNQRQRAPAPPVPFKPAQNNSNFYRY